MHRRCSDPWRCYWRWVRLDDSFTGKERRKGRGEDKDPDHANTKNCLIFGIYCEDCFKIEGLGRPVPFQLYVNPGEDVKAKLLKLFKSISHSCCIISASGHISTAEFSNLNSNNSGTYDGHFEILSLTGNCVGQEDGASWWLNVMLAGPNRMAFGSIFIDRLIAADTVVLRKPVA
ncbi:hypothetical protein Ahy_A08g039159 isoform A [Arachis hypogaea]|uniref:AT-hook motif nuclear-localized protein n=1 Tax=Arachis hypogaea TaxID=3818 RepID=A0A445BVG7_ARAHY|nr:hypothetical protein Ahy_A08g039159 isoform A [Arachis hypogaea]